MVVYKDSHKHGYFKHTLGHPRLGEKSWTKDYTHIAPAISNKFKKMKLNVKAGSAVFFLSSVVHGGYSNKKKGSVRITVTERYNPLKKGSQNYNPYLQGQIEMLNETGMLGDQSGP